MYLGALSAFGEGCTLLGVCYSLFCLSCPSPLSIPLNKIWFYSTADLCLKLFSLREGNRPERCGSNLGLTFLFLQRAISHSSLSSNLSWVVRIKSWAMQSAWMPACRPPSGAGGTCLCHAGLTADFISPSPTQLPPPPQLPPHSNTSLDLQSPEERALFPLRVNKFSSVAVLHDALLLCVFIMLSP